MPLSIKAKGLLFNFEVLLVFFRQRHAKLSSFSVSKINGVLEHYKDYIPSEFNRKMRPLSELAFWKASELRLFLLYVGIVLLKDTNILSKTRYKHFLKFAVAMRILLLPIILMKDYPYVINCLIYFAKDVFSFVWQRVCILQCA